MITAKEAYKLTKNYIDNPKEFHEMKYKIFCDLMNTKVFDDFFNDRIESAIDNIKFFTKIIPNYTNYKDFIYDNIDLLKKYFNELGYEFEYDTNSKYPNYIKISWSEANK